MALTKIDDRGLKTPIDLLDNEQIRLGTSQDLLIYHDQNHSQIRDVGTGNLNLGGNNLYLMNGAGNETYISCINNGAVSLYHNNSLRLETTTTGIDITGGLLLDLVDPVIDVGNMYTYKYGYFGNVNQQSLTVRGNEASIEIFASDQSHHAGSLVLRGGNEGFGFINSASSDRLEIINFTASGNSFALHNGGSTLSNYKKNIVINKDGSVETYHNGNLVGETRSNGFRAQGGILFNSDTADSNRLSDYEQGSFTPSLLVGGSDSGIVYSYQVGQYTKIGRKVSVNIYISITNKGSSNGNIHLGNLPFAVTDLLAGTQHEASGSVGYISGLGTSAIFFTVTAVPSPSALMLTLLDSAKSATDHATQAHLSNSFGIRCSCTYFTSS